MLNACLNLNQLNRFHLLNNSKQKNESTLIIITLTMKIKSYLSEGVAARNWFTTIDVSSAIVFPVEWNITIHFDQGLN